MSSESKSSSGVSVLGLLGVVFVTLKLLGITEVATWSWWLVLMPFWISIAIALAVVALAGLAGLIAGLFSR